MESRMIALVDPIKKFSYRGRTRAQTPLKSNFKFNFGHFLLISAQFMESRYEF